MPTGRPGFMVLELVCYCAIIACIVPLTVRMCVRVLTQLDVHATALMRAAAQETAVQAIARDIARAPYARDAWKKMKPDHIAWRTADGLMGWRIRNNTLIFYTRRAATNSRHVQRVLPLTVPLHMNVLHNNNSVRAVDIAEGNKPVTRVWVSAAEYTL